MTAVLALGETPETARYVTHDPAAVEAFLVRYPFLVPLLTEALGPLGDAFGTDTPLVVAVETDPEVADWEELRVTVETILPVDEADRRLEAFATRAGRCRGLCRYRDLLDLKVHVRIPALEDGAQFPVERPHARL
jgi:hypothetical protein